MTAAMDILSFGGLDPNIVMQDKGKTYRKIVKTSEGRWAGLAEFVFSDAFRELMARQWIVTHDLEHAVEDENYWTIEVKTIPHFNYAGWWTDRQLAAGLKVVAEINAFLEPTGWQIIDGHPNNFTFNHADPIYVDTGSFSSLYKEAAFGHVVRHAASVGLNLSGSWKEAISALESFNPVYPVGEWDNYDHSEEPNRRDQLRPNTPEQELVLDWITRSHASDLLDLGANRGVFSRLAAHLGIPVVAIEKSPVCTDQNWRIARKLELPITCLWGELPDMAPRKRLDDFLTPSNQDNLVCSTVLASSITHHLFAQGMDWMQQEALFRRLTRHQLLVEYVSSTDSCLGQWKLPESYGLDKFKEAFSGWRIIDQAQPDRPTRRWFWMEKINTSLCPSAT